jgi:hypothetical protein
MEPNLAGSVSVRSSIKFLRFGLAPFGQAVSEEKIFLTVANQKQELLLVAMFVGQMEPYQIKLSLAGSIYARSSIKHLHLVPFVQQIWPPRAILFLIGWPCLLAKWNHMKKLYREPYIDASCQVWLHLAKQFQRRRLL